MIHRRESTREDFCREVEKRLGFLLVENLPFKIHPFPQLHELMGIACITVLAGKLAPPVRIDGPGKGKIASANHPVEERTRLKRKVFKVVSLAKRLRVGGNPRDAHEFRVRVEFPEKRKRCLFIFAMCSPMTIAPKVEACQTEFLALHERG